MNLIIKHTVILGAAYSGKSAWGQSKINQFAPNSVVLAFKPEVGAHTQPTDVSTHSPLAHKTQSSTLYFSDPKQFEAACLSSVDKKAIFIDNLNLWYAQIYVSFLQKYSPEHAMEEAFAYAQDLVEKILAQPRSCTLFFASAEVGAGLPPVKTTERFFRMGLGRFNQYLVNDKSMNLVYLVAGKNIIANEGQ